MNAIGPSKPGHTDCLPCSDQFLLRGASNRDFIGLCSEAGAGVQPGWTAVPNPVVAALLCHSRGDQILCADYLLPLGNLGHGDASGSQQYPAIAIRRRRNDTAGSGGSGRGDTANHYRDRSRTVCTIVGIGVQDRSGF